MRHALLIFVVGLISVTSAWATKMQPAQLGNQGTSLVNQIKFPKIEGDFTVFVRCEAKVLPQGHIDDIDCYTEKEVRAEFYRAIHLAAGKATVLPAKVDGENVNVLMLFTAVFRQQAGAQTLAVVPNHGTNAKDLGISYVAPQKFGYTIQYWPRTELGLLWVDGQMDTDGNLTHVEFLETQSSNTETRRYARAYAEHARCIPGWLNGQPTAMRFVKPIYGYRNGFAWDKGDSFCRDSIISCDETSRRTGRPKYLFDD